MYYLFGKAIAVRRRSDVYSELHGGQAFEPQGFLVHTHLTYTFTSNGVSTMPSAKHAATYAWRAANRQYVLDWRSTGPQVVTGQAEAAKLLGVKPATLASYASLDKFLTRTNPVHGELDSVSVEPLPLPKRPKPETGKRRGRPPKAKTPTERLHGVAEKP